MNEPNDPAPRGPRKWSWRWILVPILALLGGAVFWLAREGSLDRIGRNYLNRRVLAGSNMRVRWAHLRGNLLQRVDVVGLEIDLLDGPQWRPFLRANEVRLDAGIPQLLQAARLRVEAVGPRIWLHRTGNGQILLPRLASGGAAEGGLELVALQFVDGSLFVVNRADTTRWAEGASGDASVELGKALHITVRRLSGRCVPRRLVLDQAKAIVDFRDATWRWRNLQASGAGFSVSGSGSYRAPVDFEIETRVDSLRLASLRGWISDSLPTGQFEGRIHLKGRGPEIEFGTSGSLALKGVASGRINVDGIRKGRETRFRRAELWLAAGELKLSGVVRDAGQASGTWETPGIDLELLDFLPPAWRLPGTRVHGHGDLQVGWNSRGVQSLAGVVSLTDLRIRGQLIQSMDSRINYDGRVWRLQSLQARGVPGEIHGDVSLAPDGVLAGSGSLQLALRPLAPAADSLSGRVSGDWRLGGTLQQPAASGRLEFSDARWRRASMASGLADFHWRGPEMEGLTATLSLRNIQVVDVRIPAASLEVSAGREVQFRLSASTGDSLLHARGSIRFKEEVAIVDSASLRLGQKLWEQRGATHLAWGHGGVTWRDFNWMSPDGDSVVSSGTFVAAREAIEARLDAHRWALGPLTEHFLGNRIQEGLLSGSVVVQGTLAHPILQVHAVVDQARIQEHGLDHLEISGTYAAGKLDLARLLVRRAEGELDGSGTMDLPELRERGLHAFDPGSPPWLGRGQLQGDIRIRGLDLAELSEFSDSLRNLSGRLGGQIHVEGPVTAPIVRASLAGDSIVVHDFQGGHVRMALRLQDGRLNLDSLETEQGGARITARGSLPAIFSLRPLRFSLPDQEMNFTANVKDVDLQLATLLFFKDFLAYSNGTFSLRVEAAGTLKKPRLSGEAAIKEATLRPYGREEVFRNVAADLALAGSTVTLSNLTGDLGHRGRLKGSGKLELGDGKLSGYHFDLVATNATVTDQENYSLVVSGNLQVDPRSTRDRDPLVRGQVVVTQGLLLMEFGKSSPTLEATHEQPAFRWYYDLGVTVPSDLWWRNSTANIEVGGELRASNLTGPDLGQGTFDIRRGSYDIYDTSFRITTGTVGFNGRLIDPILTMEAETNINVQKVLVNIPGGKVSELQDPKNLVFSSDPVGLSQDEIVRLLTVGRLLGNEDLNPGSVKSNTFGIASGFLRTRVQRMIERSAAGIVDVVDFGSTYENNEAVTRVGVGKYVGPDLFVKYAQGLGASIDRELSVEWRLNRIFVVRGETLRRLSSTSGVSTTDTESNVDLKMRVIF